MSTKIEWTDATWNPITGCSKVSPGCNNCYAEVMARRLKGMEVPQYEATVTDDGRWAGNTSSWPGQLRNPLRWRKPRKVFVCSMGDLFHETVPFDRIDRVFAIMALCPQHTFQVCTKRAARMAQYLNHHDTPMRIVMDSVELADAAHRFTNQCGTDDWWPMRNVWLGVSVEDQPRADERIPHLLETPAAVRFVSCEPLLGPVDLIELCRPHYHEHAANLDWVIIGAESGPGARPMDLSWAHHLRDQCQNAGVAVFVKQLCKNGRKLPFEVWPSALQVRQWPKAVSHD